jgi:hypothetical protein
MSRALPMAVDARNLTYRYGSFTAVDDVTLQDHARYEMTPTNSPPRAGRQPRFPDS